MHPELKQFLKLTAVILAVISVASIGLFYEPLNGLAWLLATPVVVGVFFILWRKKINR